MQKIIVIMDANERLDVAVAAHCGVSRSQAAKWIAQGLCAVNGEAQAKAGYQVHVGDELAVDCPQTEAQAPQKEDIPLQILYEDGDIAVVVKPCGMVVHPAAGNKAGTLVNALLFAMEDLSSAGGEDRPGIVHRLDKDTSGVIMVAKNDAAHKNLSAQLKARTMEKHYLAVVEGNMKDEQGRIDRPIARSRRDRKKMAIDPDGKEAITEWTLLENLRHAALLDVRILTGRTHQIRVHMQSIHRPVIGDAVYGTKKSAQAPRLMLHAYSISFDHPITGERVGLSASPPGEFLSILGKLRLDPNAPLPF